MDATVHFYISSGILLTFLGQSPDFLYRMNPILLKQEFCARIWPYFSLNHFVSENVS